MSERNETVSMSRFKRVEDEEKRRGFVSDAGLDVVNYVKGNGSAGSHYRRGQSLRAGDRITPELLDLVDELDRLLTWADEQHWADGGETEPPARPDED